MSIPRPTTPAELRAACRLSLCYEDAELARLLAAPDVRATLLALPRDDARRVLAGLLPAPDAVIWAKACAARAEGHAAAYAADTAAYAVAVLPCAAAAYADADAYAADAEHVIAVDHALALLGWA